MRRKRRNWSGSSWFYIDVKVEREREIRVDEIKVRKEKNE